MFSILEEVVNTLLPFPVVERVIRVIKPLLWTSKDISSFNRTRGIVSLQTLDPDWEPQSIARP